MCQAMRLSTLGRRWTKSCLMVATLALTGCATHTPDEINAQWDLADPQAVVAESQELDLLVTRIGCGSGVTGDITVTKVMTSEDEVSIGLTVEPLKGDTHTCQSNEVVPYTIDLDEPLGQRTLIDASCASSKDSASEVASCQQDAIKWTP